ncbi:hypothetical protein ACEZCY_12815 [Streptacidiphilus sp. N1-12]|uniref:Uncharacterized protein n=2 Tax=Streptacidiphilus alkalitolerans TaxID=3342712 RepID=A0ABV6WDJ1_9ACTN
MAVRSGMFGAVVAAAAAMVLACAGAGSAAPRSATVGSVQAGQDACGAYASELVAATKAAEPGPAPADLRAFGASTQSVAYHQPKQLPIGLWSMASVTLRAPATHGTVRLALTSKGFSTDSMEIQRWIAAQHRWVDLTASSSDDSFPTRGTFSFSFATAASPGHPQTVALRMQDLDRPGSLSVAASYADGHGHTYRDPAVGAAVTRPRSSLTGWPAHTTLVRGGAAQSFTLTVKNTTDRTYPAISTLFYAYGMGGSQVLTPRDLVLEQYQAGHGWTALPLVASGCDPGMSVVPRPTAGVRLAPGASATVRLRLAVAGTAPRAVTRAEAGLAVQSGDTSLASSSLPFRVGG